MNRQQVADAEARRKRAEQFERALHRSGISSERLLLKLVTTNEAAELLGLAAGTIRNMTYRKEIPVVKIGGSIRFRLLDLLVWTEERSVPARN